MPPFKEQATEELLYPEVFLESDLIAPIVMVESPNQVPFSMFNEG